MILVDNIYRFVGSNKRATTLFANKCETQVTDSGYIYQGKQNSDLYGTAY